MNDSQSVKLKSGSFSFKNYFKQLAFPFKFYPDFECLLSATPWKKVQSSDKKRVHTQKNMKTTFLPVLLIKLHVLIINSVKKLFFTD